MARLTLTLLGGLQARLDPGGPLVLPTRKSQALLAYLALPPGQAHPRDKLAALLWGGIRDESARASLRQALFAVRKALADTGALLLDADTLALDAAAVTVDVAAFEQAMKEGTPDALERAAALYRGDLLDGLVVDEAALEEWLLGERERLREVALEALTKLLAQQRRVGAAETAIGTALRLLTLDPLQEAVHRVLMRVYVDLGRRGAALRQYQHCVSALQHYREAGVWSKSVDYLARAGREAQTLRCANREAVACYEGALAALSHLPEEEATTTRAIELRLRMETAFMGLGDFARALRSWRLPPRARDRPPERRARRGPERSATRGARGGLLTRVGDPRPRRARRVRRGQRGQRASAQRGDDGRTPAREGVGARRCRSPAGRAGRSAAGDRDAGGVAAALRGGQRPRRVLFAYGHALVAEMLGEGQLLAGDVASAARRADEAVALARRYGQRGWEAWALRLQGETALARGAPDAAQAPFAEAIALADERGMRPLLAHCRLGLGQAHRRAGNDARAATVIEEALAEYRTLEMPYWRALAEAARGSS